MAFWREDVSISCVALNINIFSACNKTTLFAFIAASHLINYSHDKNFVVFVYLFYTNSLFKTDFVPTGKEANTETTAAAETVKQRISGKEIDDSI